jgi:hypothetical protein
VFRSRARTRFSVAVLVAVLAAPTIFVCAQKPSPPLPPQPVPSPNAPNPNFPPGLQGQGVKVSDQKEVDKQNQVDLQNDIDKLYALAFELREQMKMTDSRSTMSVTVVKRAQAIEKLAKEIKERAKR